MAEKEKQPVEDVGDDNLVESDNDNVMDNLNVLEDDPPGEDSTVVPKVGLKFKDENELFDFCKRYAYHAQSTSSKGKRPQPRRSNLGNSAPDMLTPVLPQYHVQPPVPCSHFPLVHDGLHTVTQPVHCEFSSAKSNAKFIPTCTGRRRH